MRLHLKEDPREWRKLTVLSLLGFSLLSSVLRCRNVLSTALWLWLLLVFSGIALSCLFRPSWFRGYYRTMTTVGFHIVQFAGRVILFAFFLLLLTPLGLCLRLAGKDLLHLRRGSRTESYWHTARPPGPLDRLY
jgi:hypothetical protein